VLCAGRGDVGTIGIFHSNKGTLPLPTIKKAIKATLPEYECLEVGASQESPADISLDFTADLISAAGATSSGALLKQLNCAKFNEAYASALSSRKLDIHVVGTSQTHSRSLSKLQFELEWDCPEGGEDSLDGICLIYNGSQLCQVIDFRSAHQDIQVHDGPPSMQKISLCRSISTAVQHHGDSATETGGEHRISMDLEALPLAVTDLFFVVAAPDGRDLSHFTSTRVRIMDLVLGRQLTEYSVASAGDAKAAALCSLTKDPDHSKWVVHALGATVPGGVKDYDEMAAALAGRQLGYLAWARRKDLVLLRVLQQRKRLTENATNAFAQLLWRVLDLPMPAFQGVISWF